MLAYDDDPIATNTPQFSPCFKDWLTYSILT
jgi:hypothetical protein